MTNYHCLVFGEGFIESGTPGTLSVSGDELVIRAGDREFALPSQGLNLRRGGATGETIIVTHSVYPQFTITLTDPAAIPELKRLTGGAGVSARKFGRRGTCCLVGCLAIIGLIVGAVIGLLSLRQPLVTWVSNKVPVSWEEKLGASVIGQMKMTQPFVDDPAALKDLETLAKPIVVAAGDPRYKFQFHIAADDQVNAFALPGGFVVVNTGLIQKADRAEEVLGVIAHELAHVTQRHSTQQVVNRAGLAILLQLAIGDAGALAGLAEAGAYLMNMSYSRTHEEEADDVGLATMTKAGIDPTGMTDFFKKLRAEEEKSGTARTRDALSFLGTHPGTADRIDRLHRRIGAPAPKLDPQLQQTFERLKQRLQQRLTPAGNQKKQPL